MYAEMLPVIQAEETLRTATAVALGSGTMEEHDQRRIRQELSKQMEQFNEPQEVSRGVREAKLASMNIKVIHRGK